MRTALYVYQNTLIDIHTCEGDLELCGMTASTVPLAAGHNARTIAPGIYKILSCHEIKITGSDTSAFDTVATPEKENPPATPPRAATILAPLDTTALNAFMVAPDAKAILNP